MLKGLIFMKSRGHQEDVLLTAHFSLIHDVLPLWRVLVERTVTSDRICFDSLPPQYSAHEGFFLLSGNKPIPGHTVFLPLTLEEDFHSLHLRVCVCLSGVKR